MRHALAAQEDPLKSLIVSSAGVSTFDSQPAARNAVTALSKVGIDISNHRSQPLTQDLLDRALVFFAMTDTHLAMLSFQSDSPNLQAYLMRQFLDDDATDQIPDPFGMSLPHYEACRDSMVEAIPSLLKVVERLYQEQTPDAAIEG